MRFLWVFLFTISGAQTWAQNSPEEISGDTTSYVMCRSHNFVRTIRILTVGSGVCVATYTKDGVDQQVARSSKPDTCKNVLERIRSNLEKAQWKCKDISQARVSSETKE